MDGVLSQQYQLDQLFIVSRCTVSLTECHRDTTKPGLWTLDWTMDWTLNSIMDSISGLKISIAKG